jgi:branched-subunit amino acid aminotransferase/4-amino-4-deoxychorismate lyase
VVLGATVAEQTRTFRHQPWRLDQHLERLFRSLNYSGITIPQRLDELHSISLKLIANNSPLIHAEDDLGLIQFVTAGEYAGYARGLDRTVRSSPTMCVHTFVLPFELWAAKLPQGVHLITPSVRQVPNECVSSQIKCRSRMHYFLAEQQARQVDPEASALLLDLDGHITETNAANFLMVECGQILSPPAAKVLPGISRAFVIELAGRLGIGYSERDLVVDDVLKADEAFLTSTPWCLFPVTRLNGRQIGDGKPGPVFRLLQQAWNAEVGIDIEAQIVAGATRWRR